jgi:ADP-dependent NAD(P)H-hydrate dehydratase / NAD(P)H-hydrate epimerase
MPLDRNALLTCHEMAVQDMNAVRAGVPSLTLMENAGRAVADAIGRRWTPRPAAVLCGPGNNGGDGWAAARHLKRRGWPVWVETLVPREALRGDAARMAALFDGDAHLIDSANPMAELFIDALYGAGLSRPLTGDAARLAQASSRMEVVSIDMPSGLSGDTGRILGDWAFQAAMTVTFHRKKPGHVLLPGREHCGEIVLADIGIPQDEAAPPALWENAPALWPLRLRKAGAHKYTYGHALVLSGGFSQTGAARLAAEAALRAGAGLVTIGAPPDAIAAHAAHLTSVMLRRIDGADALDSLLEDRRFTAVVLGPALGLDARASGLLAASGRAGRALVLDADALTLLARTPSLLAELTPESSILTPHEGEFARLFPGLEDTPGGKIGRAREAAKASRQIVLLKGADTVIAHPDGLAVVNTNAPPWLATAGAGDVLAGIAGGLLAQGYSPFAAACAGAWLHGEAARALGPGLLAEDLAKALNSAFAAAQTSL